MRRLHLPAVTHRPQSSSIAAAEEGVPVIAAIAQAQDVPLIVRGIGTVQAYNMAVIKTRVDGAIVKVSFTEGQDVKAGDPLFQIDPRPFQAALEQAQAAKERNEAQLVSAELDLYRDRTLSKEGYQSRQSFDEQTAVVRALKGSIASDDAAITNARLNLDYADIRAPVRRPHRHPPGRYRQPRPGGPGDQPGHHHAGEADLRQFHGAAERQRPGAREAGRRPARRHRAGRRSQLELARGEVTVDRQPDRHHDRHAPAEGAPSRTPTRNCGRDSSSTSAWCSPSARASPPCRSAR